MSEIENLISVFNACLSPIDVWVAASNRLFYKHICAKYRLLMMQGKTVSKNIRHQKKIEAQNCIVQEATHCSVGFSHLKLICRCTVSKNVVIRTDWKKHKCETEQSIYDEIQCQFKCRRKQIWHWMAHVLNKSIKKAALANMISPRRSAKLYREARQPSSLNSIKGQKCIEKGGYQFQNN